MKRLFRWTVAAALAALLSTSLAGVGVAQTSADHKAKAEETAKVAELIKATEAKKAAIAKGATKVTAAKKAEQGKKQQSAQEAKLQALRKSVDDLKAKRKGLLQSAEKDAPEVEKITAQIEKITQRAQELRHAAKAAAPQLVRKSEAIAKDEAKMQLAKAKLNVENSDQNAAKQVHQILQKHGIDMNQKDAKVKVRRGPEGEMIIEFRRAEKGGEAQHKRAAKQHPGDAERVQGRGSNVQREKVQEPRDIPYVERMKRQGFQGDKVGVDFPKEYIRQRVRVANDQTRNIQARQNDRSPQSMDRPGPMEVTRRLQVLEDRLSSIERKLDQLLQQVSRRGAGSADQPVGRGPEFGAGGPPGAPPHMRGDRPSRRDPGRPDGPPSDRGPGAGFGNPAGGPPQMRNENDGQDRARRPRNAEPRDGREGDRPMGPPPGANDLPPPPDRPDAPRRERTPQPEEQEFPHGRR